ncbi:hypothetical protein BD311DRAFT_755345 [Dichomitus squalens]|uniref:Uncharacterized protein n=1 Tax=Dichomitus squalens TaxID=114155 RepID=A0A4V2K0T3_9APHY|nr:hypothetical protein BD311DRAFT_755345 [Dichomitus squalens]
MPQWARCGLWPHMAPRSAPPISPRPLEPSMGEATSSHPVRHASPVELAVVTRCSLSMQLLTRTRALAQDRPRGSRRSQRLAPGLFRGLVDRRVRYLTTVALRQCLKEASSRPSRRRHGTSVLRAWAAAGPYDQLGRLLHSRRRLPSYHPRETGSHTKCAEVPAGLRQRRNFHLSSLRPPADPTKRPGHR